MKPICDIIDLLIESQVQRASDDRDYVEQLVHNDLKTWSDEEILETAEGEGVLDVDCPLCSARARYHTVGGSHIWTCNDCHFAGFESHSDTDAVNFFEWIGRDSTPAEM